PSLVRPVRRIGLNWNSKPSSSCAVSRARLLRTRPPMTRWTVALRRLLPPPCLAMSSLGLVGAHAQTDTPLIQQVEIVATSPLPGQGVDRDLLPYMTQVLRRGTIDAAQAENTSDL